MIRFKKNDLPFSHDTFLKCIYILSALSAAIILLFILILLPFINVIDNEFPILFLRIAIIVVVSGIISVILAGVMAKSTDRPFIRFMQDAYEIGRGNFSVRLPQQNNILLQRLARLIHYMADEMDRLGQVNIQGIIAEKNKTEAILRNIADAVIVTDTELRILVMNNIAEKWFGVNEKQLIAKPLKEWFKNSEFIRAFEEVIHNKPENAIEFEYQIINTAVPHILQAHTTRVTDESGKVYGAIAVLRDVTKEREADRVKTELVSMVAHELKSPLTSIYGFSELLMQKDQSGPKFNEYVKVIMSESTRLTEFVNKFLDLSRLEAGKIELKKNLFDMQQLIMRMLENQIGIIENKKIKVITDFPEILPQALGDQGLFEQVLINLFSNAVKYSPEHSKIGIEVKVNDNDMSVNIIDSGYGIPKESLPKIFNKFYRVPDRHEEEEVEGSGLGLALVKEIIERHGGSISVQSRFGVGSIFTFTVPFFQESIFD